ncbi:MAG: hypothetical protein Q9222_000743 [Ikaeria aurantiellina]
MTAIDEHPSIPASQTPQWPLRSDPLDQSHLSPSSQSGRNTRTDTDVPVTSSPTTAVLREPMPATTADQGPPLAGGAPYPLTREKTAPAIGPSLEKPAPLPQESEISGLCLLIMLLLTSGSRHPFKMDERYLKKRNVNVDAHNPVNMSVYTLKELIWREWRDDWEIRPSSPSAIRLIYYGKMLEDKSRLHDCRFQAGLTPHVVHMTIKPQEIMDEEDAKIAKTGSRDHDGNEGSARCRCVIL